MTRSAKRRHEGLLWTRMPFDWLIHVSTFLPAYHVLGLVLVCRDWHVAFRRLVQNKSVRIPRPALTPRRCVLIADAMTCQRPKHINSVRCLLLKRLPCVGQERALARWQTPALQTVIYEEFCNMCRTNAIATATCLHVVEFDELMA